MEHAWPLPGGTVRFAIDRLAAFFLMPVFFVSALGSVYGEGYWSEAGHPGNARRLRGFYGIATAGLLLVMAAGDAWTFLIGWEVVGLAAFFLVTTEQDDLEALRAGWIYLIATHCGTLVLFAMFALLHRATGTWFLVRSDALGDSGLRTPILVLALLGFGIKAGVIPFHVWLPGAHAAAPTHVSALLSAVVLKMGIYGLVRVFVLLPAFPVWLRSRAVGAGHHFRRDRRDSRAGPARSEATARLPQRREHRHHPRRPRGRGARGRPASPGLGRSRIRRRFSARLEPRGLQGAPLLRRGRGDSSDGNPRPGRARGPAPRMRFTGAMFLVGAVAICGLPPLNGFVSEWLISFGVFGPSPWRREGKLPRLRWARPRSPSSARLPWPASSRPLRPSFSDIGGASNPPAPSPTRPFR